MLPPVPELLAPAGDWDCVRAAVANGADAVYFGLPRFNARLRAENFSEADLPEVVAFCHRHGVKAYVAFNTLVFTGELEAAGDYLRLLNGAAVDALIVQDIGLVRLARQLVPDLPLHASTQMTVTSPEGVEFVHALGLDRVVLGREVSLKELERFDPALLPLEVFVHGALCVAYSGQCLTSEALGQRSANRGECAQACRMPYALIVDGVLRDLGDRRYLLSPQDLAAVNEIPELIRRGVVSLKIEGRLKSPEYVAAICQVYRKAIDAALAGRVHLADEAERYRMEMTFSRGLSTGWMHGVDHQSLVPARYGKKRGALAGRIATVGCDYVTLAAATPLKPGDGVVFDIGGDPDAEQGGRIFSQEGGRLTFQHGHVDFARLKPGDRVWKTSDPVLEKALRQSFTGRTEARRRVTVDLVVRGGAGLPLVLSGKCVEGGWTGSVRSAVPLEAAHTAALTQEKLRAQLGKLGETGYVLGALEVHLEGPVILPLAELNRLRRELVGALDAARRGQRRENTASVAEILETMPGTRSGMSSETAAPNYLRLLCRSLEQLDAVLSAGGREIYLDLEDIRRGKEAVQHVRNRGSGAQIYLATPRIQKAGEQGFFKLIENASPDGVLLRNLGGADYFAASGLRCAGDFSLNVANPLAAEYFISRGLERVTISYDLNAAQVADLLRAAPPHWFELTLHQHIPMFHMEHCVFAAFLSEGKSYLDCGRPCETHRVHLRDRVGQEHPLRADVGCRNTLFNAVPQTGAEYFATFAAAGLHNYRVELLEENAVETREITQAYQALLAGECGGNASWRKLHAQSQLGVTRGPLEERR